jgi:hypothetical protein
LAKKRAKEVSELHSSPRKMNPDVKRRVVLMLDIDLVIKLKTAATQEGISVQKLASRIMEQHLK